MSKNINALVVALAAFCCFANVSAVENVSISLFATDLHGCDDLSKCDAFVEILCVTSLSDGRACGKTKYIQDDNFPVWPEVFTFTNTSEEVLRRWQFKLIDDDVAVNDPITTVVVQFADFIAATETQRNNKIDLGGLGFLYVTRVSSS